MSGEQAFEGKRSKGVRDDRLRGLGRKSLSPKLRKQVETELEDLFAFIVGPKPTAAGEFLVVQVKDRPVLQFVGDLISDFARQPFQNLRFGKWAAEGVRDIAVSPEFDCKGNVFHGPVAKSQARGLQKIVGLWRRRLLFNLSH